MKRSGPRDFRFYPISTISRTSFDQRISVIVESMVKLPPMQQIHESIAVMGVALNLK
jgi:hypothetical protein